MIIKKGAVFQPPPKQRVIDTDAGTSGIQPETLNRQSSHTDWRFSFLAIIHMYNNNARSILHAYNLIRV